MNTSWPVPLCTPQVAHCTSFLSGQHDVIASFSFGACNVQTKFFGENFIASYIGPFKIYSILCHFYIFLRPLRTSMGSPRQKHWGCGHLMAGFNTHSFCARCRGKGKGPYPCISKSDCQACNVLTEDQCVQFSTPSYRLKKEKRELNKLGDTPLKNSDSSSLTDPSSVTLVGAVDDQGMLQSPGSSSSSDKKKKDKKSSTSDKPKAHKSSEKPSKSVDSKPSRSSADARIDELDQKWSDRFNRLEALLLSRTLDKPEHTFQAPKVTPTHPPPVGAVKSSEPFIQPTTDRLARSDLSSTDHTIPQVTSKSPQVMKQKRSTTSDLPGNGHTSKRQSTSKRLM